MTTSDGPAFEAIFTRVQKLYGKPKDAEMALAYFQALVELPLTLVDSASLTLVKTNRFFPRPVDWLEAAYKLEPIKKGFAPERWVHTADGHRVATVICPKCSDSGWCPECGCALEDVAGKCKEHGTGSSASSMPVQPCHCRDTNPEFAMRHRTIRQFTEQR
jgi:hypothetical protein